MGTQELRAYPGQLLVPAEDVNPDQGEDSLQRRQDLLGDVVSSVEPQAGVLQNLQGPPHQLNKRHSWYSIHYDIGDPLADSGLRTTVMGQHPPEGGAGSD